MSASVTQTSVYWMIVQKLLTSSITRDHGQQIMIRMYQFGCAGKESNNQSRG